MLSGMMQQESRFYTRRDTLLVVSHSRSGRLDWGWWEGRDVDCFLSLSVDGYSLRWDGWMDGRMAELGLRLVRGKCVTVEMSGCVDGS
jgi:hypothetical protein